MSKILPEIIFGILMLTLGVMALFFPDRIHSTVNRIIGEKKAGSAHPNKDMIWSARGAGIIGIFMGLIALWFSLKSLFK